MTDENTRGIGSRLNELGERIELENDPERRYVFLLFQDLTSILYDIHKSVKDARHDNYTKIDVIDSKVNTLTKRVDEHAAVILKNEVSFKWSKYILVFVQSCFTGVFFYGYELIADLRDTVHEQAVVLPRLEKMMDAYQQQNKAINETREAVMQQSGKIAEINNNIDGIDSDVRHIKKLKVVRGSK